MGGLRSPSINVFPHEIATINSNKSTFSSQVDIEKQMTVGGARLVYCRKSRLEGLQIAFIVVW